MITETRKRELEKMNAKNSWAFCEQQIYIFLDVFCEYAKNGLGKDLCEEILYRLEDCNFHTLAKLLSEMKLQEALEWVQETYK